MQSDNYVKLAEQKGLTTYHYKVILYLLGKKEATQSEMAHELETTKQNINKMCKELESMNVIEKKRIEGRNIFWILNPTPTFEIKGQTKCI